VRRPFVHPASDLGAELDDAEDVALAVLHPSRLVWPGLGDAVDGLQTRQVSIV
jgi:hypothetical protein